MYPARVSCQGCPADPFAASKARLAAGKPRDVGHHVFDPAAVERPAPGSPIEVPGFEGWAWPELDKVNPRAGGAPRAHVDALKLLAVFVQHSDSKPEQQDLVCAPGRVARDRAGNETVQVTVAGREGPRHHVREGDGAQHQQDGPGGLVRRSHLARGHDLRRRSPRSLTGSLENPRIGEAGRAFLAGRLAAAQRPADPRPVQGGAWPSAAAGRSTTGSASSSGSATKSSRHAAGTETSRGPSDLAGVRLPTERALLSETEQTCGAPASIMEVPRSNGILPAFQHAGSNCLQDIRRGSTWKRS